MRASTRSTHHFLLLPVLALFLGSCAETVNDQTDMVQTDTIADTTGTLTFGDWRGDAPGVRYHIRPSDLPAPSMVVDDMEESIADPADVVDPPEGAQPQVPDGFQVSVFATDLEMPRRITVAPNGDIFVAETGAGRVLVYPADQASAQQPESQVFADGLDRPYGIAFVPADNAQWVYVGAADQVVRYPYSAGDVEATGSAEVIVDDLPTERHWTKDLAVSQDGQRIFLAVGSASNMGGNTMGEMTPEEIAQFEETHGRGAAWGEEENRAVVRVFDLNGSNIRNYATGLRNCSGLTVHPQTGDLWCAMNERDHLGPNMAPDYVTRIQDGGFYGWPWYIIGDVEDPARAGERPDLSGEVLTPDVLIQAHSSTLDITFYDQSAFPAEYHGDAFATLHGSHSRPDITGYKVIRVPMQNGQPTGGYEDFMTGFVVDNDSVWGRPAGIAVTHDGALLVSDDANGTIFRVTYR